MVSSKEVFLWKQKFPSASLGVIPNKGKWENKGNVLPFSTINTTAKNQHVFNKCNVDCFIWPSVHKIILLYVWKQHTGNKIMKTFTIHKYTDLMQDVYSLLDFNFFFSSQFSFPDNTFFKIYVMKKLLQRVFSPIQKRNGFLWMLLNINTQRSCC